MNVTVTIEVATSGGLTVHCLHPLAFHSATCSCRLHYVIPITSVCTCQICNQKTNLPTAHHNTFRLLDLSPFWLSSFTWLLIQRRNDLLLTALLHAKDGEIFAVCPLISSLRASNTLLLHKIGLLDVSKTQELNRDKCDSRRRQLMGSAIVHAEILWRYHVISLKATHTLTGSVTLTNWHVSYHKMTSFFRPIVYFKPISTLRDFFSQ